jgi:hypothetical protein
VNRPADSANPVVSEAEAWKARLLDLANIPQNLRSVVWDRTAAVQMRAKRFSEASDRLDIARNRPFGQLGSKAEQISRLEDDVHQRRAELTKAAKVATEWSPTEPSRWGFLIWLVLLAAAGLGMVALSDFGAQVTPQEVSSAHSFKIVGTILASIGLLCLAGLGGSILEVTVLSKIEATEDDLVERNPDDVQETLRTVDALAKVLLATVVALVIGAAAVPWDSAKVLLGNLAALPAVLQVRFLRHKATFTFERDERSSPLVGDLCKAITEDALGTAS